MITLIVCLTIFYLINVWGHYHFDSLESTCNWFKELFMAFYERGKEILTGDF